MIKFKEKSIKRGYPQGGGWALGSRWLSYYHWHHYCSLEWECWLGTKGKVGALRQGFWRGILLVGTPWVRRGYAVGTSWVRFCTHAMGTLVYPRCGYAFVPMLWVRFSTHAMGTLLYAISMHTHKHKYWNEKWGRVKTFQKLTTICKWDFWPHYAKKGISD